MSRAGPLFESCGLRLATSTTAAKGFHSGAHASFESSGKPLKNSDLRSPCGRPANCNGRLDPIGGLTSRLELSAIPGWGGNGLQRDLLDGLRLYRTTAGG